MKKLILAVLALVMASGCTKLAVDHNEIIMPDGRKGHSVTCQGMYNNYCIKRMGEECPNGYEIVGNNSSQNTMFTGYVFSSQPINTYYFICR